MKLQELKNKTEAQLQDILQEERDKLLELRFKVNTNQLKTVRDIRATKKVIAKVLTLLNENK